MNKNTKKNSVSKKNNIALQTNNKKKTTKKKGPIISIKGKKNKCGYLDVDCLFNVKKQEPTPSDLFYPNVGEFIGLQSNFQEPYYKKCKDMQTYNTSSNRNNKFNKVKSKKKKSKGGWEMITVPKILYSKKNKKKTCFKDAEDYPLNLELDDECYHDYQCKSTKCDAVKLFGTSFGGTCVEPLDYSSKNKGDSCEDDRECKKHLICRGSDDVEGKICILNKKYVEEIDSPNNIGEVNREKIATNPRWTYIKPNFKEGDKVIICKEDKDCEKGHCIQVEVTPEDISKQNYSDVLRKRIFGYHADKIDKKYKKTKSKVNICHKIGLKCDSKKNEDCRRIGSSRGKSFRDNLCCGKGQMCDNNICIPLNNGKNIPLDYDCLYSKQCKSKFCDPMSKLCKTKNPNIKQCQRHKDCDSISRSCYDGSCIEIEELPKGQAMGGEKCVRDEQCVGKSKCSRRLDNIFIQSKEPRSSTYGVDTYFKVCEDTPVQAEKLRKNKKKTVESTKNIMNAFIKYIKELHSKKNLNVNDIPRIIYSYNIADRDIYKTVIIRINNKYYLGKMTVDKDTNNQDVMTIYYFDENNSNTINTCSKDTDSTKSNFVCPNDLFKHLKIITDSDNYELQYGIKYNIISKENEKKEKIIKDIKTKKFIDEFRFNGTIRYNGVAYNNQKKIYKEITIDKKVERFLNIPNTFLYNLLVYMLFFEKYEISIDAFSGGLKKGDKCNNFKNTEPNTELKEIDNITDVCNHNLGYIHHIPYQNREDLLNTTIINFTKHKLCGYQLNPIPKDETDFKKFYCDENNHDKFKIMDIPYTINYKSAETYSYAEAKFTDTSKLNIKMDSTKYNENQYLKTFKKWLNIIIESNYYNLDETKFNMEFGIDFTNINFQTKNDIKQSQVNKTKYISDIKKNIHPMDITEYIEKQTIKNNDDSLNSFDDIDKFSILSNIIDINKD